MFAFKFKDYSVKNNLLKYGFLLVSILLILFFRMEGVGLAVLVYILLSVAEAIFRTEVKTNRA